MICITCKQEYIIGNKLRCPVCTSKHNFVRDSKARREYEIKCQRKRREIDHPCASCQMKANKVDGVFSKYCPKCFKIWATRYEKEYHRLYTPRVKMYKQ